MFQAKRRFIWRAMARTFGRLIGHGEVTSARAGVPSAVSAPATMRRAAVCSLRTSAAHRRPQTASRLLHAPSRPNPAADPLVRITTLPNGIRVATENTPGHFSSVGLYVDAGSRYESPSMLGASHFVDRMAFKVCDLPAIFPFDCLRSRRPPTTAPRSRWRTTLMH